MSRLISWVRPPLRPRNDSRSVRCWSPSAASRTRWSPSRVPIPYASAASSVTAGRDGYPGLAELHQYRALRLTQPSTAEPQLPKLIMAASRRLDDSPFTLCCEH